MKIFLKDDLVDCDKEADTNGGKNKEDLANNDENSGGDDENTDENSVAIEQQKVIDPIEGNLFESLYKGNRIFVCLYKRIFPTAEPIWFSCSCS